MPTLHTDWRAIVRKAWSVRFIALAGLLSGAEVALQIIQPMIETKLPPGMFAALAGLATAGALVARVMAQANLSATAPQVQ